MKHLSSNLLEVFECTLVIDEISEKIFIIGLNSNDFLNIFIYKVLLHYWYGITGRKKFISEKELLFLKHHS